MRFWLVHRGCRLLVMVLLSVALAGCGWFGAFYGIFIDPLVPAPTVDAEYDMKESCVLVWVDDAPADVENPLLRRRLTQQIQQELLKHKAVRAVIQYERISRFRLEHSEVAQMPLQQLGDKLQADVVLYVFIDKFQLHHEAAEGFFRLSLSGCVKLIEVGSGSRVWPATQTKRCLSRTGELVQGSGQVFEDRQVRQFCQNIAEQIARFFYKHRLPK